MNPTDPYGQFSSTSRRSPALRWRVHYIAYDPTGSCKGTLLVTAATAGVAIRKAMKSLQLLPGLVHVWVELRV